MVVLSLDNEVNLYLRGNGESIDWLIVIYIFPDGTAGFDSNAEFDPSRLSAVFGQVKIKEPEDIMAKRPIGIYYANPDQALPYLAILMELGTESNYCEIGSKMKMTCQSKEEKMRSGYSISVRGASKDTYGILSEAGIEEKFGTLFKTTALLFSSQDDMIQHTCPLQRFSDGYTAWMDYGMDKTPEAQ